MARPIFWIAAELPSTETSPEGAVEVGLADHANCVLLDIIRAMTKK